MSTNVSKIAAQRNQRVLLELALKPGNDICADCRARAPRWASYNLGIFICVHCASIHRKIGTHVTKIKSITLDEWTKEQVEVMKENGNVKSNLLFNPNEARHPPPTNMIDSERDSELEKFIRSKYEFKRFMDRKSSGDARVPPSRARPIVLSDNKRKSSPGPPLPPKTPENLPPGLRHSATIPSLPPTIPLPTRSASQPLPPLTQDEKLCAAPPHNASSIQTPIGQVWEDLVSLQVPSQSSSLPLQYSPGAAFTPQVCTSLPATPGINPFANVNSPVASSVYSPGVAFPFIPSVPSVTCTSNQHILPVPSSASNQPILPVPSVSSAPNQHILPIPSVLPTPNQHILPVPSMPMTPTSVNIASLAGPAPLGTANPFSQAFASSLHNTGMGIPPSPQVQMLSPAMFSNSFGPANGTGQVQVQGPGLSVPTNPFSSMQMQRPSHVQVQGQPLGSAYGWQSAQGSF